MCYQQQAYTIVQSSNNTRNTIIQRFVWIDQMFENPQQIRVHKCKNESILNERVLTYIIDHYNPSVKITT